MSKQEPFQSFLSEATRQRLDSRLKSLPIQESISQSLSKELGKVLTPANLNTTFQELATGRVTLDQTIEQLATTAAKVLDRAMKAEQKRSDEENHINQQFQAAFQPIERVAGTKPKSHIVQGQVLDAETQEPIAGLVVQATDRDVRKDDFLGVAITNAEGRFEIGFTAKDFREDGENLPEVMFEVGIDRKTMLFKTIIPLAVRPHETAQTTIHLPAEAVAIAKRLLAQDQQNFRNRAQQLNQGSALTQYHHLQAQAIGNALKAELTQFLNKSKPTDATTESGE